MKVVETNIAIAANGKSDHASLTCQLACIEFLDNLIRGTEKIAIDDIGLILEEYAKHLSYSGQPEVGDAFFKHLNDLQYNGTKVHRTTVTPNRDNRTGFNELPQNKMDPSDRKFLAVAHVSGATIVNALDNDWHENKHEIEELGIVVLQLCPEQGCTTRN